jgi:hypothetical protein
MCYSEIHPKVFLSGFHPKQACSLALGRAGEVSCVHGSRDHEPRVPKDQLEVSDHVCTLPGHGQFHNCFMIYKYSHVEWRILQSLAELGHTPAMARLSVNICT